MSQEEREDTNILVLTDDEGEEHEFELVDVFEVDDKEYAVLIPIEEGEESDEAVIMRVDVDENGDQVLVPIEDDDEFEQAVQAYEALCSEEAEEDEEEDE